MARYNTNLHANKNGYILAPGLDDNMTERAHSADPYDAPDTYQQFPVGTQLVDITGNRKFRYCQNGAYALGAGHLVAPPIATPHHISQSVLAAAIGDTTVSIVLGATPASLNQYRDGFFSVNSGTGTAHQYRVKSNPAIDSSGTGVITLYDPIKIALVASGTSLASLLPSRYRLLVVAATTPIHLALGSPIQAVAASKFFWAQTWGPCPLLIDQSPAINTAVISETTTTGGVKAATAVTQAIIGYMVETGVDNHYKQVFLQLDA